MYSPVYGTGLEIDSKDNFQVGWTSKARVDYRFRSSGGLVKSIAVNLRGGSGYSGGNGGQIKAAIQADVNGQPSGTDLASVTWSPGNPAGGWEDKGAHAFTSSPVLTAGSVYHIVFSNTSATQTTDYVSLNTTTVLSGGSTNPLQAGFTDDFAFFYNTGSGWTRNVSQHSPNITPVMDLMYVNGTHDGNAYFQATVDYYALVNGVNEIRETMMPKVSRQVASAYVRLKRISGTSPITFTFERSDGTVLASGVVSGSQIPASTYPAPTSGGHWDEASLSGGRWVGFTFPAVTLAAGSTYDLRLQTASDTTYLAMPIREVSNEVSPTWGSRAFRDGEAQKTSGTTWAPFYEFAPHDLQFYLR